MHRHIVAQSGGSSTLYVFKLQIGSCRAGFSTFSSSARHGSWRDSQHGTFPQSPEHVRWEEQTLLGKAPAAKTCNDRKPMYRVLGSAAASYFGYVSGRANAVEGMALAAHM